MRLKERLTKSNSGSAIFPRDEPEISLLNAAEQEWQACIYKELMTIIDPTALAQLEPRSAHLQIHDLIGKLFDQHEVPLNPSSRDIICQNIEDEILGLGPIQPLLNNPAIADILVNGYRNVYVEQHGRLEKTSLRFRDDAHLMNVIDRIVSAVGRRVDESSPMVDARLKDGSRVNVIIPPLAIDGPCLSIRRFPAERLQMEHLIAGNTLTRAAADVLKAVVSGRLNLLISGGTGSGKTTLLNVLSGFIAPSERIITIEDAAELQLQQPHVVRLETRPPNIEGRGEVRQRELVRNALRMRPERILLGEVRGDEAFDLLQAMNTGHDGSLATIHANAPRDALARLENMVAMSGIELPARMVRAQIASAIHVVLQIGRLETGERRLLSIQEITGMEGDVYLMSEIFRFERKGLDDEGRVIGQLQACGIVPMFSDILRRKGIELPASLFSPLQAGPA
ncbi:MAG: hypothetical protein RIQ52_1162 [Pseudomonadota bacterium]|jgi:pilus assembly protein CpaF